ncbi:MAG: DUF1611 domain-containing protein [Candidatus Eisenbacteria bacterium]|uniref:DUF1611 domain-containing protein n=1 Tax=Eiseniibacteriota bacterium TaxID=2212470 RepID=A0A538TLJ4_UNCEI|nr:MAG: DUF1611 domain-containing protein [Candidatus Eisenbacteria bacterium]
MLGRRRRLALLAEGCFTTFEAKTAVGVLRYRADEVAAVIDSTRAGTTAAACVGAGGSIPVVADVTAAAEAGADALLIGVAPRGGELPAEWRAIVCAALDRGWDVLSGLHVFLADDPELAARAAVRGARLLDVRRPAAARLVATRRAADLEALVVLTVGSDCNVGKMTAALEICRALEGLGLHASFVATGQTGIFVADRGVAVDAVPADFVAGVVEELVVDAARLADVVMVEGQGALHHPGYSGVTLALLHGACPAAMILCHHPRRGHIRSHGPSPSDAPVEAQDPIIPPLHELVRAYESAAAWVAVGRVTGIALHTGDLSEAEARSEIDAAKRATGLPATDPVRFGAETLARELARLHAQRRSRATLP